MLVLLGDGQGGFAPQASPAGPNVDTVAVGDFNGDGKPDVAGVEHDSYEIRVYVGDGKGGLTPGARFPAFDGKTPHTHSIGCADVNGDGHVDLLTSNADDDAISVLLGKGDGKAFVSATPIPAKRHPYAAIAIEDLNGDGHRDVVVPLIMTSAIGVYLGDGRGGFSAAPGSPLAVGERPGFAMVADVNEDGRPDILATHDDVGQLDVLLNEGEGRFGAAPGSPVRVGRPAWSVAAADFDGDGNLDALLSAQGPGRPTLMLGDERGGFRDSGANLATGQEPNYVEGVDVNGDGVMDIVTSNYTSGDLTVLLGVRNGQVGK